MKNQILGGLLLASLFSVPAHAISHKYQQQLERSGCTQITEAQGCDIHKTKAENAKAGNVQTSTANSYAGSWTAVSSDGATVASIKMDANSNVTVDGHKVSAKRIGTAVQFKNGTITYTVQRDKNSKTKSAWKDADSGTQGEIVSN